MRASIAGAELHTHVASIIARDLVPRDPRVDVVVEDRRRSVIAVRHARERLAQGRLRHACVFVIGDPSARAAAPPGDDPSGEGEQNDNESNDDERKSNNAFQW